ICSQADYKPGTIPLEETDDRKLFCKYHYKGVLVILIPLVLGPMFLLEPIMIFRLLFLTFCIYSYYILNLIAQGALAFTYIVLIPILGIAASKPTSIHYFGDVIYLTFGTVFMCVALESSKLADLIGTWVLSVTGAQIRAVQVMLAVLAAINGFVISPTLSSGFWMKVAQACMIEFDKSAVVPMYTDEKPYEVGAKPYPSRPAIALYLTCCFAANFGGMASPLVNPNGVINTLFKMNIWGIISVTAVPAIVGFIVMIIWIQIIFLGAVGGKVKEGLVAGSANNPALMQALADKKAAPGRWGIYPILTLILTLLLFILVVTRHPSIFTGWGDVIGHKDTGISIPTIAVAIMFFAIPANYIFCRYYACREPEKPGPVPSIVTWKMANVNCPWAEIYMMCAGVCFMYCAEQSKFYDAVVEALKTDKGGPTVHTIFGALYGTALAIIGPATPAVESALPIILKAGNTFAFPFALSLQNQLLLPTSSPGNTMVAGLGNIRPFQFV
ncbi:hypothetical protein KR018_000186, partial [Drosophila ironensis]